MSQHNFFKEKQINRVGSVSCRLTHVVEGAAAGWRDLEQTRVDEGSEGGGRLVFGHGVAF